MWGWDPRGLRGPEPTLYGTERRCLCGCFITMQSADKEAACAGVEVCVGAWSWVTVVGMAVGLVAKKRKLGDVLALLPLLLLLLKPSTQLQLMLPLLLLLLLLFLLLALWRLLLLLLLFRLCCTSSSKDRLRVQLGVELDLANNALTAAAGVQPAATAAVIASA